MHKNQISNEKNETIAGEQDGRIEGHLCEING